MALNAGDGIDTFKKRATFADLGAHRAATPVSEQSSASREMVEHPSVEVFTFEGRHSPRGSPRTSPRVSPRVTPSHEAAFATFSTWASIHTVAEEEECVEEDGQELRHSAQHNAHFRHGSDQISAERQETSIPVATERD